MKIKQFMEFVLPKLQAESKDLDELRNKVGAFLKQGEEEEVPVVNEDGSPVEIEQIILVGAPADPEAQETPQDQPADVTQASLQSMIRREIQSAIKSVKTGKKIPVVTGGDYRNDEKRTQGFKSFGEFAWAVYQAGNKSGSVLDHRLMTKAPTTYASEGVGADGGFLVPPEFSDQIREHSLEGDALLPLTDEMPVQGNSMTFPADETTPWGSNGVRCFWEGEGDQATQTKPVLKQRTLRLNKLIALVPMTDELLSDTSTLEAFITNATARSIRWKTNDAIINGTGAGQPLGIANSSALVTVAKETSQTADTVVAANVAKMYARVPASGIGTAVWIANNDVFPQLITMTLGNQPIWTPPSTGLTNAPGGMLFGRPVILSQTAKTVGDAGDIYFADMASYATIKKDIINQTSIHLFFDYDMTAFKAVFRVDGQPWLSSSITPNNGSNNLSPFVNLAARA